MTLVQDTGAASRAAADARGDLQTLRSEKAHLLHWRRLVRGRLDLAVAACAPPPELGEMGWGLVTAAQLSVPLAHELTEAIGVGTPADTVALLHRLRTLDRRLAAYGHALDEALEETTEQVAQLPAPDAGAPTGGAHAPR